ncbi:MAG: adenine deaminase [Eubacteriales bacterium]|nr:adenine deaminase [Eubacteriales bacterium]
MEELIRVARGEKPAELVLKNARVVNVFSGEIVPGDVAIYRGKIAGVGKYEGEKEEHLDGCLVAPAFIDSHIHLESTLLLPAELARVVVPRGTGTVVADPHEIANVQGKEGVRFLIEASRPLPLDVYFMAPSCVPATHMETAGAELTAADITDMLNWERVLGIAEMMNYPGVLSADPGVMAKIKTGEGRRIDGHAPGLLGEELNAYAAAGIASDHEAVTAEEALARVRAGMYVMVREGSTAKNIAAVAPVISAENSRRFLLVSDDRHPEDLMAEGHVDWLLRRAVAEGIPPLLALQMVTLNPAEYFGFRGRGAVAPGYRADLVVLEDLREFKVIQVYKKGQLVARTGQLLVSVSSVTVTERNRLRVAADLTEKLKVKAEGEKIKVIGLIPNQIVTEKLYLDAKVEEGLVVADPSRDIVKIAVIERHRGTGNVGVGFVRGLGLKKGALAATVAHDSHNLIVAGVSDADMEMAVQTLVEKGGGMVAVAEGEILAVLPLPVAGLMSDRPAAEVAEASEAIKKAARQLGCVPANPFMALSFLALPVIPHLKITDRGLVDVDRFAFVSLFDEE